MIFLYVWGWWVYLTKIFLNWFETAKQLILHFVSGNRLWRFCVEFSNVCWQEIGLEHSKLSNKNFMAEFSALHLPVKMTPVGLTSSCLMIGEWWSTAAWEIWMKGRFHTSLCHCRELWELLPFSPPRTWSDRRDHSPRCILQWTWVHLSLRN